MTENQSLVYVPNLSDGGQLLNIDWTWSFYIAGLYIISIFIIRNLMKRRKRGFEFRKLFVIWDLSLAIFSILGAVVCVRDLLEKFSIQVKEGWYSSVCESSLSSSQKFQSWILLFALSKISDLVISYFFLFRNQTLRLSHYFHHATALVYTWYSFPQFISTARWLMAVNLSSHALQYAHMGLRAAGVRLRGASAFITCVNSFEMLFGMVVNGAAIYFKWYEYGCHVEYMNIFIGFLLYATYLFFIIWDSMQWSEVVNKTE